MRHLIAAMLLLVAGQSAAAPVVWTLEGVTFDDGVTLEGGFTYDADTDTYSDVYLYASDTPFIGFSDTLLPPFVIWNGFGGTSTGFNAETWYDFYPATGLNIEFGAALTNAGGSISIATTSHQYYWTFDPEVPCCERYVVAGNVSAVPVPAAVWLFVSALAGLGVLQRRSQAA